MEPYGFQYFSRKNDSLLLQIYKFQTWRVVKPGPWDKMEEDKFMKSRTKQK